MLLQRRRRPRLLIATRPSHLSKARPQWPLPGAAWAQLPPATGLQLRVWRRWGCPPLQGVHTFSLPPPTITVETQFKYQSAVRRETPFLHAATQRGGTYPAVSRRQFPSDRVLQGGLAGDLGGQERASK